MKKKEEIDDNDENIRQKALDEGFEFLKKYKEGHLFNDKSNFKWNSNPKISAVLPVFNRENTLKHSLNTKPKNVRYRNNFSKW